MSLNAALQLGNLVLATPNREARQRLLARRSSVLFDSLTSVFAVHRFAAVAGKSLGGAELSVYQLQVSKTVKFMSLLSSIARLPWMQLVNVKSGETRLKKS